MKWQNDRIPYPHILTYRESGKRIATRVLLIGLALLSAIAGGCGPTTKQIDPNDYAQIKAENEQLNKSVAARDIQIEELNKQIGTAHKSESQWMTYAMIAFTFFIVGTVFALIAGAAMGSRTRRDAERSQRQSAAASQEKQA